MRDHPDSPGAAEWTITPILELERLLVAIPEVPAGWEQMHQPSLVNALRVFYHAPPVENSQFSPTIIYAACRIDVPNPTPFRRIAAVTENALTNGPSWISLAASHDSSKSIHQLDIDGIHQVGGYSLRTVSTHHIIQRQGYYITVGSSITYPEGVSGTEITEIAWKASLID